MCQLEVAFRDKSAVTLHNCICVNNFIVMSKSHVAHMHSHENRLIVHIRCFLVKEYIQVTSKQWSLRYTAMIKSEMGMISLSEVLKNQ